MDKKYLGCEPGAGDSATDFYLLENGKIEVKELEEGEVREVKVISKKQVARIYGLLLQ